VTSPEHEFDADTLRALALFALAGAQISWGDSSLLPSSPGTEQPPPSWVYLVAALLPLATFVYLLSSGG
jgi:hypothetical protein